MNTTMLDLEGGSVVPVIHPDTGMRYFLLRINADMPLSRTIARVIGETWEQEPTGADVPRSHD